MSFGLRPCGLQGWAVCEGNCEECRTTATTTADGYWYHGNGKLGGEFRPNKPNDEERYGEYVKVKHGRWLPSDKGDCTYICSECGFIRDAYILEEKAYCPRCGADMREVKE